MRIVVTGATGFLGRHLLPRLIERYGGDNVVGVSRQDYDLMDPHQVHRLFLDHGPHGVIHLAAYSGGIGANRKFPADFYYRNTLLTTHLFHTAAQYRLKKLIYTMGGCSYPAGARSPIDENQMWDGFPQGESAGYAMAKKMGLVASRSYRRQYGLNSVVLIPGNMFGEYDNFRTGESHVIPAMIRRCYEASRTGSKQVVMWGSGRPVRDFVYAGDVASSLLHFIEHYDSSEPVNISTGTTTSIRQLSEIIRELVGFEGEIVWDASQPDGQETKIFDVSRMKRLGLECPTELKAGLRKTVAWFARNYPSGGDRIRLGPCSDVENAIHSSDDATARGGETR